MSPADASGLYRALHVQPTLVLALGATFVRRDPSRDPPVKRQAITLQTFVAHKGLFALVRPGTDVSSVLTEYLRWSSRVNCSGEDDPRVLPFHVFETSRDWSTLGSMPVNQAFADEYGPASGRCDDGRKRWRRAQARHGREVLTVAGFQLTAGMHWDVDADGREARICTSDTVWKLRGRRAYLNIYPDGRTRPPQSQAVRKVWPKAS